MVFNAYLVWKYDLNFNLKILFEKITAWILNKKCSLKNILHIIQWLIIIFIIFLKKVNKEYEVFSILSQMFFEFFVLIDFKFLDNLRQNWI